MTTRTIAALILAGAIAAPGLAQNETTPALKLVKPGQGETQAEQTQPEKPKLYDEEANAREQIAAALAKAKKENQRVLIQWGGNWCGWCIKLNELCTTNREIAREILYEYQVVHVDAGRNGKNMDLAASFDAEIKSYPYLTILDSDGKTVTNQHTEPLEAKDASGKLTGGHNPEAVLEFLKKHEAAKLNASEVLAAGLEEARRNAEAGKGPTRVFLHFGAPWCGWCHRLEDWMARDEVGALLGKDFVDVKIDTDRMIGGAETLTRYRGSERGGIPWFVMLDAEGKAIMTSDGPEGNVGFPVQPQEIAHFEAMLRKSATALTGDQIDALIASLRQNAKAILGG